MDIIDVSLAIKLMATASVVLLATVVAERAGPLIGAMIVSLPVSAGPAYVFLALEHGSAFVAKSALTSLAVNASISPFLIVGAALITRVGAFLSLSAALCVWLTGAFVVLRLGDSITLPIAIAMNVASTAICLPLSRLLIRDVAPRPTRQGAIDLVVRICAVVLAVAAAILLGRALGPRVAGVAALLPVVWLSTVAVIYARSGADTCAAIMANGVVGMISFAMALIAVVLLATRSGATIAFLVAIAISISWNLGMTLIIGMRRRARARVHAELAR